MKHWTTVTSVAATACHAKNTSFSWTGFKPRGNRCEYSSCECILQIKHSVWNYVVGVVEYVIFIPGFQEYNKDQHWICHIGKIPIYSMPENQSSVLSHFCAGSWWLFADRRKSTMLESSTSRSIAKYLWGYVKRPPRSGWMHSLCYNQIMWKIDDVHLAIMQMQNDSNDAVILWIIMLLVKPYFIPSSGSATADSSTCPGEMPKMDAVTFLMTEFALNSKLAGVIWITPLCWIWNETFTSLSIAPL